MVGSLPVCLAASFVFITSRQQQRRKEGEEGEKERGKKAWNAGEVRVSKRKASSESLDKHLPENALFAVINLSLFNLGSELASE